VKTQIIFLISLSYNQNIIYRNTIEAHPHVIFIASTWKIVDVDNVNILRQMMMPLKLKPDFCSFLELQFAAESLQGPNCFHNAGGTENFPIPFVSFLVLDCLDNVDYRFQFKYLMNFH
jgi:hypothetical protein